MAKKYKITLEVEVETAAINKETAVSFTQLLTCPEIQKITGVKRCGVVSAEETK